MMILTVAHMDFNKQQQMVVEFDPYLQHPFSMIIAGSSGCGKTTYLKEMLVTKQISPPPVKVFWFYSEWQDSYNNFPDNVEFVKGLPSSFDSFLESTEKYICSHSHT
jgi:ABC-type dipeptide/oligopeptide/nickel transport system ATPase subunit